MPSELEPCLNRMPYSVPTLVTSRIIAAVDGWLSQLFDERGDCDAFGIRYGAWLKRRKPWFQFRAPLKSLRTEALERQPLVDQGSLNK